MIDVALAYADRGIAVFPCVGKRPLTEHGFHDATDDHEQIARWWTVHPDAAIGRPTGEAAGVWVLDIDDPAKLAELPTTYRVDTPSGGAHLYFAWDNDAPIRTRAGVWPGVDTRGSGGYVLAAGSPGYVERGGTIAHAPAWLLQALCASPSVAAPSPSSPAAVERIDDDRAAEIASALACLDGHGRQTWLEVGMALHSTGDESRGYALWTDWSRRWPEKFDEADQRRVWASFRSNGVTLDSLWRAAYDAGWGGWSSSTPTPAVPRDIFARRTRATFPALESVGYPPILARYLEAVAEQLQVPVEFPTLMALPIMATVVAKHRRVHIRDRWSEPSALWVLVVMPSGERKSAVMSELLAPLTLWEECGERTHAKAMARWAAECSMARKNATRLAELHAHKPKRPRVYVTEATTEALARLMSENHGRILVACAESDPLDVAMGRYSGRPNFGAWLAGHAGDAYADERMGRDSITLRDPALSLAIGAQPGAVHELFGSALAREKGFLARFLVGMPDSLAGRRNVSPRPIPDTIRKSWYELLAPWMGEPEHERPMPLSPGALSVFLGFCCEIEGRMAREMPAERRGWISKLPGTLARVAGTLAAIAGDDDVTETRMAAVLTLAPVLEAHLDAAVELGGDPVVRTAQHIARWLADHGGETLTRREIYMATRRVGGASISVAEMTPSLDLLVEDGWLSEAIRKGKSVRYRVAKSKR